MVSRANAAQCVQVSEKNSVTLYFASARPKTRGVSRSSGAAARAWLAKTGKLPKRRRSERRLINMVSFISSSLRKIRPKVGAPGASFAAFTAMLSECNVPGKADYRAEGPEESLRGRRARHRLARGPISAKTASSLAAIPRFGQIAAVSRSPAQGRVQCAEAVRSRGVGAPVPPAPRRRWSACPRQAVLALSDERARGRQCSATRQAGGRLPVRACERPAASPRRARRRSCAGRKYGARLAIRCSCQGFASPAYPLLCPSPPPLPAFSLGTMPTDARCRGAQTRESKRILTAFGSVRLCCNKPPLRQ